MPTGNIWKIFKLDFLKSTWNICFWLHQLGLKFRKGDNEIITQTGCSVLCSLSGHCWGRWRASESSQFPWLWIAHGMQAVNRQFPGIWAWEQLWRVSVLPTRHGKSSWEPLGLTPCSVAENEKRRGSGPRESQRAEILKSAVVASLLLPVAKDEGHLTDDLVDCLLLGQSKGNRGHGGLLSNDRIVCKLDAHLGIGPAL